ncbi:hypothetical protein WJX84_001855 [Apatococcus fuscideae]|uniref:Biogenesis of lysosome-related organelles complex 1 subunit 7 n=1 Tax=Apatococcus fuscideae TaxID=2026836 RepID=A0AAW1T5S6_9CHLO
MSEAPRWLSSLDHLSPDAELEQMQAVQRSILAHLEETRSVLAQYDTASRELADESCQELLSQEKVLQALKRQLDLTYESLMRMRRKVKALIAAEEAKDIGD